MLDAILLLVVGVVAFSNGANDNFKGVATLFGSRTTDYRKALAWATVTTLAGSLTAIAIASGLVAAFSGKGLVPDALTGDTRFLSAVGMGAGATVLLASRLGIPISTTHALVGGILGAGLVATGGAIRWGALGTGFVLPLLASPFVAMGIAWGVYPALRSMRLRLGVERRMCLCAGPVAHPVVRRVTGALAFRSSGIALTVGQASMCEERYLGRVVGFDAQRVLDSLHYVSAGLVGFARGVNDTPKIVSLLIAAGILGASPGIASVAVVMAAGGILGARRVAHTMSHRITAMNHGQAFTANFVAAALVLLASRFAVPVSTTHVTVGSLAGIGAATGTARWRTLATIGTAWVTTLPLAALIAAFSYAVAR